MGGTSPPEYQSFSASMRLDAMLDDWRAEFTAERDPEARERGLYERAWAEYQAGDYGFGLWCWRECDRLQNALGGSVREVTRVLGPGHYLGFSHRRAIAEKVPLERVYRPRKGDMSTPRPEAIVIPAYQMLSIYAVRAEGGDRRAAAELEIARADYSERRREDPYRRYFESFLELLARHRGPPASGTPPTA